MKILNKPLRIVVIGVAGFATACLPLRAPPPPGAPVKCGSDRWDVKTGTDPLANRVSARHDTTTVDSLIQLPRPGTIGRRTPRQVPSETKVYVLQEVRLVKARKQGDRDIHVVITQSSDPQSRMIVEFKDAACQGVATSPWLAQMSAATAAFLAACGPVGGAWVRFKSSASATITGVAFFDRAHGQSDAAPNNIELHPVLDVKHLPPTRNDCR